jgi:hypothetical protein
MVEKRVSLSPEYRTVSLHVPDEGKNLSRKNSLSVSPSNKTQSRRPSLFAQPIDFATYERKLKKITNAHELFWEKIQSTLQLDFTDVTKRGSTASNSKSTAFTASMRP